MGKYIIELKDRETLYKASIKNGEPYVTIVLGKPYTAPDLEQVNKDKDELYDEARARGYDEGRARGYQEGLFDAWDAARKIENLPEAEKFEIFGEYDMFHIMRRYTATEAIKKIRQYEQSQKELEQVQKEKEKSISVDEFMRQYLDKFCKSHRCRNCALNTDDFTCGRGYYFTTIDGRVSDEEVRRAYAEVMKK